MKSFFFSQNDSDVNAENEIYARTAPISFQRGQQLMMFNHWCWQRKEWLSVVLKKSIF